MSLGYKLLNVDMFAQLLLYFPREISYPSPYSCNPPVFILALGEVSRQIMGMQHLLIVTDKWRVAGFCACTAELMDG